MFTDIYVQPLWCNRPAKLSNSLKKTQIRAITPFKIIQGHRNRYESKAVCDFLLVINSNWHPISHAVSELSQLIVQILDTAFLIHRLGVRDNVRCSSWAHWKAHTGLPISINWTFFARCYAEALLAKIGLENRRFRYNAVSLIQNFRYCRCPPTIIFAS